MMPKSWKGASCCFLAGHAEEIVGEVAEETCQELPPPHPFDASIIVIINHPKLHFTLTADHSTRYFMSRARR
jgi:hypothetical protein